MASFVNNQENRTVGQNRALAAKSSAISAHHQAPVNNRAVLGEIQNVVGANGAGGRRHQPLRGAKPPQGTTSFSIYCDESTSTTTSNTFATKTGFASTTTTSTSSRTGFGGKSTFSCGAVNKENVLPKDVKVEKSTNVQQTRVLRSVQEDVRLRPALAPIPTSSCHLAPEPMNTSVAEESPMVMETSMQAGKSCQADKEWRVPPIQDEHTADIFTEPEYAQDVYRYLRDSEVKHLPKANYMLKQNDITHGMRSILVDWLVEVGEEYKLQTETLHLAVNYIDRFLSYMAVQRSKLQLVGAACMFIAAKYEEIYPPDVGEFVYITDDTYNKRQVLRMEHLVLKVLNFDLSVPTTHLFISKIIESVPGPREEKAKIESLANYLSELALVEGQNFLRYCPSLLAASCVAMARHTLNLPVWPDNIATRAGYSLDELKECFMSLHGLFSKAESHPQQAVRDKYKDSKKYHGVADLTPPAIY